MRHVAWLAVSVMLGGCVVTPTPHAQTPYPVERSRASAVDNIPAIAGRISVAQGDVRVWRTDEDGSTDWDDADVNDVVTTGSRLWTGQGARTEVRFGPHALRLAGGSILRFDQLDEHHTAVRMERGTLTVRLNKNDYRDTLTVLSGPRSVELRSPGRYRIDGDEQTPLRVTSFRGEAVVRAGGNSLTLREGRSLDVSPDGGSLEFGEAMATAFDEWSLKRDERLRDLPSARYVSPYMTGYEELDAYGDWVVDPTYGNVWAPRVVVAGWAPYRHGRWRWVSPWGWTWVDEAPWGFAPFHYGRWVSIGARWCWWPGAYVARPVYAPALVGWVGRPGWSVSVSVGSPAYVGWYPLAPWNAYQPRYISSVRYHASINQNIIQAPPSGAWRDQNIERGGTAVPGNGFRDPIRRGGAPLDRVVPVRDVQPMAPPSRVARGPGVPRAGLLQPDPAQQAQPPAFDRDTRQPHRQFEPAQQQPPQPEFDRDTRQPRRRGNQQDNSSSTSGGAAILQPAPQTGQPSQPPTQDPRGRPQLRGEPSEPGAGPRPGFEPPQRGGERGERGRIRQMPERMEPAPAPAQPVFQQPAPVQRSAPPEPEERGGRGWHQSRPFQAQPQVQQAQPQPQLRQAPPPPQQQQAQPRQREPEQGDRSRGNSRADRDERGDHRERESGQRRLQQ